MAGSSLKKLFSQNVLQAEAPVLKDAPSAQEKKNIKTNQVLKSVSKSMKNGKVPVMCLKTVKFLVHTASHRPSPWVMNLGTFFFHIV